MRPSASFPACWLASEGAKNTPRYSSGLVCGVPTAPITAGAQPCMPGAPFGADDARTRRRTRARRRAISWATKLPMENPSRSAWRRPSAATKAFVSRAVCSIVSGVRPAEPPTPE